MRIHLELDVNPSTGAVSIVGQTAARQGADVPADQDAPFGRDQFGTPYVSAADRARGEALRDWPAEEATNYTGSVDPDTLGEYDWAFYVQKGLWRSGAKDYAIFTKKPIPKRADGSTFNNPEAELAGVDVSGYTGPLASFA